VPPAPLPSTGMGAVGPDGNIWFAGNGRLGRIVENEHFWSHLLEVLQRLQTSLQRRRSISRGDADGQFRRTLRHSDVAAA